MSGLVSDGEKNSRAQSDAKVEIIDFAQLSMQVTCISFRKPLLVGFYPKLLENLDKLEQFYHGILRRLKKNHDSNNHSIINLEFISYRHQILLQTH